MSSLPDTSTLAAAIRAIAADPIESVTYGRVVEVALQEVSGSEFGGISELTTGAIRTRAASDVLTEQLDRVQYDTHEGPCMTAAVAKAAVVICNDLAVDDRWPVFGRAAADLGVNSVISFKLYDGRETIGALNLYGRKPHAFDSDAEEVGALLAAHAAVVMTASRKQENLSIALETRDVIGQAKGILMERYKLDDREAFNALIAVSQHTHRKLRVVADQLRTTGELPGFE
jgi:transcriptional regulator with GAF, ATPase, and Fis domain